jgi:hypothetical protein
VKILVFRQIYRLVLEVVVHFGDLCLRLINETAVGFQIRKGEYQNYKNKPVN